MENNIDTQLELALETMQSYEDSESELLDTMQKIGAGSF